MKRGAFIFALLVDFFHTDCRIIVSNRLHGTMDNLPSAHMSDNIEKLKQLNAITKAAIGAAIQNGYSTHIDKCIPVLNHLFETNSEKLSDLESIISSSEKNNTINAENVEKEEESPFENQDDQAKINEETEESETSEEKINTDESEKNLKDEISKIPNEISSNSGSSNNLLANGEEIIDSLNIPHSTNNGLNISNNTVPKSDAFSQDFSNMNFMTNHVPTEEDQLFSSNAYNNAQHDNLDSLSHQNDTSNSLNHNYMPLSDTNNFDTVKNHVRDYVNPQYQGNLTELNQETLRHSEDVLPTEVDQIQNEGLQTYDNQQVFRDNDITDYENLQDSNTTAQHSATNDEHDVITTTESVNADNLINDTNQISSHDKIENTTSSKNDTLPSEKNIPNRNISNKTVSKLSREASINNDLKKLSDERVKKSSHNEVSLANNMEGKEYGDKINLSSPQEDSIKTIFEIKQNLYVDNKSSSSDEKSLDSKIEVADIIKDNEESLLNDTSVDANFATNIKDSKILVVDINSDADTVTTRVVEPEKNQFTNF